MAEGERIQVVVRIVKAELTKNFESMGKMDPYATCSIVRADGNVEDIGQTRTDWNAHMNPIWNHTFTGQQYAIGDKVKVAVWEDDVVGNDDLIGEVIVPVTTLTGTEKMDEEVTGPLENHKLMNKIDAVGAVFVQAMLVKVTAGGVTLGNKELTRVDSALFESPVHRLGVSGGTAPFFTLKMKTPGAREGNSSGFYIGKDLSHAADEIMFYEQLTDVINGPGGSQFAPLLRFCFEYLGVATMEVADAKPGAKPKELIIMRNLFDGAAHLRLLDIKIGQKTADAGWQGKSRMAALKQSVVDGLTNSAAEGYRLEGFDGVPPALESMNPLEMTGKMKKKAFRVLLQTRPGTEVLSFFLDVHKGVPDCGEDKISVTYSPTEFTEIVASEIVTRLTRMAIACRLAPYPQKWIGSSVALAFDAGQMPLRTNSDADIRTNVKVHIFDWGRSELNTLENHSTMTEKERQDRALFWGYYVGGIDRLAFEATRLYYNRFCMAREWAEVQCNVMDFDSNSADDFLGRVVFPLRETPMTTVNLKDSSGREVSPGIISSTKSTLTYSIKLRTFPTGFRLKGAWQIMIHKANNLIASDKLKGRASSDPFVILNAVSKDGTQMFRQQTCVVSKTVDPVYDETLEVPIASRSTLLEETLKKLHPELVKEDFGKLFPPEAGALSASGEKGKDRDEPAIKLWTDSLDQCAADVQGLEAYFRGQDPYAASQSGSVTANKTPPLLPSSSSSSVMQELKAAREKIAMQGEQEKTDELKVTATTLPVETCQQKRSVTQKFDGIQEVGNPLSGNPDKVSSDVTVQQVVKTGDPPLCGVCGENASCGVM